MHLKIFTKNIFVYALGYAGLRIAQFILIPAYTRYLSISNYGLLETSLVTIQLIIIFMSIGMRSSFIRFYSEYKNKNMESELLGTSILISICGGIITSIISYFILVHYFGYLSITNSFNIYYLVMLICISAFIQSLLFHFMAYFQANNNALQYTIINILITVLLVVLTVASLSLQTGIYGILFAQILSYGIFLIFVSFKILRKVKFHFSFPVIPVLFSFGFPLIFEAVGWFILNSSDRYFIGHYSGLREVAIYSLGYKLASILLILIVMPFDMVYGPFIFSHMKDLEIKKYIATFFTYLVLLLGLGSTIILLFSKDLIRIAAPSQYSGSLSVLMVILPVIAMNGIYYWSAALLHIVKKTYIIGLTMIVAAILSLILNYLLVPKFGWMGAAISINVTFLLAVIVIFSIGMRNFYVSLEKKRLAIVCGTFISIITIFVVIRKFPPFSYYSFVVALLCSIPLIFKIFNFVNEDEKAIILNILSKYLKNV